MSSESQFPSTQNQNSAENNKSSAPFAREVEMAWQLYREQLNRNFELMKIITEMQKVLGQSVTIPIQQLQLTEEKLPAVHQEPLEEINSLPIHRFRQLEKVFPLFLAVKRTDAIEGYLESLYALYQLKEVYPEKLFMHLAIPDSTGYRYSRMLQSIRLMKNQRGKLALTKAGIMLMEMPLETFEQYHQLIEQLKKEEVEIQNHKILEAGLWFQKQEKKQ